MASPIFRLAFLMALLAITPQEATPQEATPQEARSREAELIYACKPALPVFCRNIHVSCSGKTTIPALPFEVFMTGSSATVAFGKSKERIAGSVTGRGDRVVRLSQSRDWIRIQTDGRYSHRTYRDGHAAMSSGVCQPGVPKG